MIIIKNYFKFISKTLSRLILRDHSRIDARHKERFNLILCKDNFDIENLIDLVEADR